MFLLKNRKENLQNEIAELERKIEHRTKLAEVEINLKAAECWKANQKGIAEAEHLFHCENEKRKVELARLDGEIAAKKRDEETIEYLKSVIDKLIDSKKDRS